MRLLDFVIIKLTLCFIAGILIGIYLTVPLDVILNICPVLIILLLISFLISRNQLEKTIWFGAISFLTMICIGILVVNLHDQKQFKNHYSKVISDNNQATELITFKVREVLKPTAYQDKYIVDLLKHGDQSVTGKILLNVEKDSLTKLLQVDDVLITSTSLSEVGPPLNPFQFDYKSYLERRYIYHQIFVETPELLEINSSVSTIYGYAACVRSKIDEKLKTYDFKSQELAIVDALLLGQRKDISADTYNNYVNAGAIHILAVSGLHIGIILLLLNKVFEPVERLRHGKILKTVIVISILWSFAVVAGLSPSVTRAVAMFTIVAIGMNLNRPANIYNTLAISMFVILLVKPLFLFEVGFQMSYLAVLAIASIQPMLVSLWKPKYKLVNYYWKILCVTTAAQIGVVPISLFYFHQFPGLFFLSNLIIIPFLGFILGFGILVIILALMNFLHPYIADIFGFIISSMNDFIAWVSHQESFVLRNISFGALFVIVSYVMIVSLFSYFKKPNHERLVFVLVAVLMLQSALLFQKYQAQTKEFIVWHKSKFSMIGIRENERLMVGDNLDSLTKAKDNIIRNYKVGMSMDSVEEVALKSVYNLGSEKLLVVDSLGIYNVKSFKPDYILLRNSPKLNLNRLIDSLQPKGIIADGSNYKSYVTKWKATCEARKIPLHITYEKGAFVYQY